MAINYLDDILPAGGVKPEWSRGIVAQELYIKNLKVEGGTVDVLDSKMTFATSVAPFHELFCTNSYYSMQSTKSAEPGSVYAEGGMLPQITGWKLMDGDTDNLRDGINNLQKQFYEEGSGKVWEMLSKRMKNLTQSKMAPDIPSKLETILKNNGHELRRAGDGSHVVESVAMTIDADPTAPYYLNKNLPYTWTKASAGIGPDWYFLAVADYDPLYRWGQHSQTINGVKKGELYKVYVQITNNRITKLLGPDYNQDTIGGRTKADDRFDNKIKGWRAKMFVEMALREYLLYTGQIHVQEQLSNYKSSGYVEPEFTVIYQQAETALDAWEGRVLAGLNAVKLLAVDLIQQSITGLINANKVKELAISRGVPSESYQQYYATLPRYSGTLRLEAVPTFEKVQPLFDKNWNDLEFFDTKPYIESLRKARMGQKLDGYKVTKVSDTDIIKQSTFLQVNKSYERFNDPTKYMHSQILRDANYATVGGVTKHLNYWQDVFFNGHIKFVKTPLNMCEKPYNYDDNDPVSREVVKRRIIKEDDVPQYTAQEASKLILSGADPDGTFRLGGKTVKLAIQGLNLSSGVGDQRTYSLSSFNAKINASNLENLNTAVGRSFQHLQVKENPGLAEQIIESVQWTGRKLGETGDKIIEIWNIFKPSGDLLPDFKWTSREEAEESWRQVGKLRVKKGGGITVID
jgi:hypothetical protein